MKKIESCNKLTCAFAARAKEPSANSGLDIEQVRWA
jgi:hypothetical protein